MPNKLLFGSDIDFVIATLAYSSAKGSYLRCFIILGSSRKERKIIDTYAHAHIKIKATLFFSLFC